MKRTQFQKCLMSLVLKHDVNHGLVGVAKQAGIPYQTLRKRLINPRGLRWYEYLNIVESLRLNADEESELMQAIKEA